VLLGSASPTGPAVDVDPSFIVLGARRRQMSLLVANEARRKRQIGPISPVPLGAVVQGVFRRSALVAKNCCVGPPVFGINGDAGRIVVLIISKRRTLGSVVAGKSAIVAHVSSAC